VTARRAPLGVLGLAVLGVALGACGSSGSPAATAASFPPDAARVVAQGEAFTTGSVAVPADAPFSLVLDNRDGEPHNVTILAKESGGKSPFVGEVFSGPSARLYSVPALPAGTYQFRCDVHQQMTGTIVAG
jgi:plastocyanin